MEMAPSTRDRILVHEKIISAVGRAEFISDRMSYITLRSNFRDIIVLNVHAPTEDKSDVFKESFYEELKRVLDKFPKYHMKILLRDFNAKVGRKDIFKPTIWNVSVHEIINDNGVTVVNFTSPKIIIIKNTVFPHRNIHKYTWTSNMKTHNKIDHISIYERGH
jgi:hypothetical protein